MREYRTLIFEWYVLNEDVNFMFRFTPLLPAYLAIAGLTTARCTRLADYLYNIMNYVKRKIRQMLNGSFAEVSCLLV